ncbi:MAG TPA: hypothetical protein VK591_08005 [Xanthobacteraceae bacterium]|nr:hypothetical protein [Xanthobacteraceae bacterium]
MSSEREKLIEIWLDSAGERQYQFAFRNSLLTASYTILHDTSHTALELGKDVIAVAPNGELIAYQLKGNPGGRITISQWHELIPQINALVHQPIFHPAVKNGTPHTPFLVTNGEIHEDVLAAIAAYNSSVSANSPKARGLRTIARGQLLRMFFDSADTLWPAGIQTQRNILNVYAAAGNDELPIREFVEILSSVLRGKYSDTAIPAVHLVTAILASNWIGHENYFELVKMYTLLAISAACYQARWKRQRAKDKRFFDEIMFDVRSQTLSFIDDLLNNYKRPVFLNRDAFNEFGYYHPRKKMIAGVISAALLDRDMPLNQQQRDGLRDLVCNMKHSKFMLWEGIVPCCLAEFWALSNFQGTREPDRRLAILANDILNSNGQENPDYHLPGPYYSLGDVVRWKYKTLLQNFRSNIDQDDHYRRSWFVDAIFMVLVRRNYKQTCKLLWPSVTRFTHIRTQLPDSVSFGPMPCENAISEEKLIDTRTQKNWDDLTKEASETATPEIPTELLSRPFLTLLYCLFLPQRMDRNVILWLDRQFCKSSWY